MGPSRAGGQLEGDEIRLRLPGSPAYGRLARIAASSLARRLGFTFREIEDLALAVDETIILLLQPADDATVDGIEVDLRVVAAGIEVEARAITAGGALAPAARARFDGLVTGTVTEWSVQDRPPQVRLVARHATP